MPNQNNVAFIKSELYKITTDSIEFSTGLSHAPLAGIKGKEWYDSLTEMVKLLDEYLKSLSKDEITLYRANNKKLEQFVTRQAVLFKKTETYLSDIIKLYKFLRSRFINIASEKFDLNISCNYKNLTHQWFDHLEMVMFDHWESHEKPSPSLQQEHDKRLFQRNKTLSTILNAISEMVILLKTDGTVVMANQTTAKILSKPLKDIIDKKIISLLPLDVAKTRWAVISSVLNNGKQVQFEDESSGRFYLNSVYPIQDITGQTDQILFISYDVSERKMATMEQQAAKQMLRTIIEAIPIRVFWKNKDNVYLGCNSLFAHDAGCTKESDIIGKSDMDFWPKDGERLMQEDKAILEKGKARFNITDYGPSTEGNIKWYLKNKIPLRDTHNQIIGILGAYQDVTREHENLQKLQMNEARYRSLFEDSPIPLWEEDFSAVKILIDQLKKKRVKDFKNYFIKHPDYFIKCMQSIKVINVNQAALKLGKINSKTNIYDFIKEQYTNEPQNAFRNELVAFCKGNTSFKSAPYQQIIQGQTRWIIAQASIAPGYEETWEKIFISIIDVTEQIHNELALKESEHKYRVLFENANASIFIMSPYKIIDCNPKTLEMFQMEREELLGLDPLDDLSPKSQFDNQISAEKGKKIIDESMLGNNMVFEWIYRRKDHTFFPAEVSLSRFVISDKIYIQALVRDITDRKKAQQDIFESEKKYRNLFETMAQGVIYQNTNKEILSINPAVEKILGLSAKDLIGKTSFLKECQAIHRNGAPFIDNDYPANLVLQIGKPVSNIIMGVYNQVENEYKWILITAIPQYDKNTTAPYLVYTTFDDITEQIKITDKVQKYATNQEILLQEVNHRVKNNMSAIISMLHKEMDRAETNGSSECMPMLQNLESRVNGLLTVHSILSSSKWQPIQMDELCQKIIANALQSISPNKNIKLTVSKTTIRVNSRIAHNLAIVLNELTINTIKYVLQNRDSAKVKVHFRKLHKKIRLTYKDDGPGFPPKILAGKIPGSRIGFSLINGIIEHSLGGKVDLYNHDGAVVEIVIPNKIFEKY